MSARRRGRVHVVAGLWSQARLLGADHDPTTIARDLAARLGLPRSSPLEAGDLVLAGHGFGAGTTTDTWALALAEARVGGLLAESLHSALRESCLCAGVPVLAMPGLAADLGAADDVIVDFATGTIENVTRHRVRIGPALSPWELKTLREAPALAWYGRDAEADADADELPGTVARAADAA